MAPRDCSRNAGFVSLHDTPEEVYIAGVIVVTYDEHGNYGTRFEAESLDELPPPEVQLDLGQSIASAWAAASIASSEA